MTTNGFKNSESNYRINANQYEFDESIHNEDIKGTETTIDRVLIVWHQQQPMDDSHDHEPPRNNIGSSL